MQTTITIGRLHQFAAVLLDLKKTSFYGTSLFLCVHYTATKTKTTKVYLVCTVTTESPEALQPGSHTFGVGSPFLLPCPLLEICNVAAGPLMCCCMFSWLSCCHDLKSVEAVKYRVFLYAAFPVKHPTLCFVLTDAK